MDNEQFEHIKAINYWQNAPTRLGFHRTTYTNQIISYLGNHLIKVLIGQRRSGKSFIIKQTIARLLEKGIPNHNILYLNFELHELRYIQQAEELLHIVEGYFQQLIPQGKVYLFFDEIQEVENWEKVINSYLVNERYDVEIFITGSNAHLLSTELSTYITGRYIEIPVYPFTFYEYVAYYKLEVNKQALINYLENSGIPEIFNLKNEQQKTAYILSLKDSILMNDVIKRFQIKNPKLLQLLLDFIIDNVGHLFSLNAITNKLKSSGVAINVVTASNYIHYLEMTYIIHSVPRYDVRGKRILEGERKYYLNDLGLANYMQSSFEDGVNKKLENYIYQVLVQTGFKVFVGTLYNLEIDFVAEKNKQKIYLQVTYLLHSQEVINREYGNLESISDDWPKWVVSMDDFSFPPKNGILHVQAWKLVEKL